ncbi:hypothetical protein LH450_10305 [Laribacter hongkongensis]|nr:hypothetical protein [Laribacter hongkongensis]MCG9007927.1 hypothetical protein [Laribacter hongkongensis]MCG9038955.1 hypothetical protein [Laribacter hongkongensis]
MQTADETSASAGSADTTSFSLNIRAGAIMKAKQLMEPWKMFPIETK